MPLRDRLRQFRIRSREWTKFTGEHGDGEPSRFCCCFGTRRFRGVLAGGADRRTGRLPALPAARPAHLAAVMVDRAAQRRPRLDRAWRSSSWLAAPSWLLCLEARGRGRARRRARQHVSGSVSLRAVAAGSRAGLPQLRDLSQLKITSQRLLPARSPGRTSFAADHSHPAAWSGWCSTCWWRCS